MALYSKKQLKIERSRGLILSDEENNSYNRDGSYKNSESEIQNWSNQQFENWLSTKSWSDSIKDDHRSLFKGQIGFTSYGTFYYPD